MVRDSDVVLPELSDVFDDPHEAPTAVGAPAYRPRGAGKGVGERATTPAPSSAPLVSPVLPRSPRVPTDLLRSTPGQGTSGEFLDALPVPKPRPSLLELERQREVEQQRHLAETSPGTLRIDGLELEGPGLEGTFPKSIGIGGLDDPFEAPSAKAPVTAEAPELSVPPALFGASDAPEEEPLPGAALEAPAPSEPAPVLDVEALPPRRPRRRSSLRPSDRPPYMAPEPEPRKPRPAFGLKHLFVGLGIALGILTLIGVGIELSRVPPEPLESAEVADVQIALPPMPEPAPLPVEGFTPSDLPESSALPRAQARRQAEALLEQSDSAATLQERLDFLQSAALSDPRNPEIAAELARVHEHEPRLAVLWASHAVLLRPSHGGYRLLLGDLQAVTGDIAGARESFEQARRHGVALAARRLAELDTAPAP